MDLTNLLQSFGAHGSSKILVGPTGNIMITKDGSQLLPQLAKKSTSLMEKLALQMCVDHGERFGDGSLGQALVLTTLFNAFKHVIESKSTPQRSLYIRTMSMVQHVFHIFQEEMRDTFVACGLWKSCVVGTDLLHNICHTIVQPATNATVARHISHLICTWFEHASKYSELSETAQHLVQHFDANVFTSFTGDISASYIVPHNTIIFEGRFKNHSILASSHVRFACLQCLQSVESATSSTHYVGLHTTLLQTHQLQQVCSSVAQRLDVLFCAESVSDAELCVLSQHNIQVVDCVPMYYLQLIVERTSHGHLYTNVVDLCEALCLSGGVAIGQCDGIARVLYGASDTYLKITITRVSAVSYVPQIVMRCRGSLAVASVYRRLLRRCFVMLSKCSSDSAVVTPGGGANELIISAMWSQIASLLGAPCKYVFSSGLLSALHPLAARISRCFESMLSDSDKHRVAVIAVLCNLAEAYLAVPRQLLRRIYAYKYRTLLQHWMLHLYGDKTVQGYVYKELDTTSVVSKSSREEKKKCLVRQPVAELSDSDSDQEN